ncbi:hypothetical protein H6G91_39400 [Nostoc muscorum FACHB-395]|nr:hypothetical protein [Desmonostoc muscorum FACHB-395]
MAINSLDENFEGILTDNENVGRSLNLEIDNKLKFEYRGQTVLSNANLI